MHRQIYLEFTAKQTRGVVDLAWDHAPSTCEAIWSGLQQPMRINGMHSMFVGPEVALVVPPERRTFGGAEIPKENQTSYPMIADLVWLYIPEFARKGAPDAVWEIGFFHDNGARLFGPLGWFAANVVGKMTAGFDEFAAACRSIRTEGTQVIEIGRV